MRSHHSDYKADTVRQWTADPCGANLADGEPGTASYFESLDRSRDEYAPWLHEILDYPATAGMRVLEVGCGQGIDLVRYARAGARATAIDLTPRHVELARLHLAALGLAAEVVQGDAERLPFPDATFDRVSSTGVLHHTPGMEAAIREILRVLKPGGEARLLVYNRNSLHYWVQQVLARGILRGELVRERSMGGVLATGVEYSRVGARPLVRVYSPRQMRRILFAAGFADATTEVRHFRPFDAFVVERLARVVPALRRDDVLERVARRAGWYVIASGRRSEGGPA